MSAGVKIQREPEGKGSDITNFKRRFRPKRKIVKLPECDTW